VHAAGEFIYETFNKFICWYRINYIILHTNQIYIKMKKYNIKIERDENAWNPREDDNFTTMVCFHKRYDLGDKHHVDGDAYSSWEEMEEAIKAEHEVMIMKPLYMYEHSGITISTSPFSCSWDSGRLGLVYITKPSLMKLCGRTDFTEEELSAMLESEVKTYDMYVQGEVYSYSIYEVTTCSLGHEHEELLDSCGGYYGEEEAREEADSIVKVYQERTAVAYHS
jgi:hypothetical protein